MPFLVSVIRILYISQKIEGWYIKVKNCHPNNFLGLKTVKTNDNLKAKTNPLQTKFSLLVSPSTIIKYRKNYTLPTLTLTNFVLYNSACINYLSCGYNI